MVPAILALGLSTARADDKLIMPFDCDFQSNQIVMKPGLDRSYAIAGPREERGFTTCSPPFSNQCRTMMVYRFSIMCGRARVPWVRVVAAARQTGAGRVWLEKGYLNISRQVDSPTGSASSCADASARSGLGMRGECLPWQPTREVERIVLPAGFAPAAEIGARFVLSGAANIAAAGTPMALGAVSAAPAAASGDTGGGRFDFGVKRNPLPKPVVSNELASASDERRPAEWITRVVEAHEVSEAEMTAVASATVHYPWPALSWIFAVSLMAVGASFAWVNRTSLPQLQAALPNIDRAKMRELWIDAGEIYARSAAAIKARTSMARNEGTGASYDPELANAAENVNLLLVKTEVAVFALKPGTPLRDVLEHELGTIRQRLASAKAQAIDGKGSVTKLAAQFRALIRELDRVQRITASAAHSFSSSREPGRLPETKSEAYEILGVNADVSDATLKKLIDALRMTWHPDLARDDVDRAEREHRIKQINVAWELITGRRRAV